jgi:hypothetical protein
MILEYVTGRHSVLATAVSASAVVLALPVLAQTQKQAPKIGDPPEALNVRLVGSNDLQGRTAYQPTIVKQDTRYIAYIGHHGGSGDFSKPHIDRRRDRSQATEVSRSHSWRGGRRRGGRRADDAGLRWQVAGQG